MKTLCELFIEANPFPKPLNNHQIDTFLGFSPQLGRLPPPTPPHLFPFQPRSSSKPARHLHPRRAPSHHRAHCAGAPGKPLQWVTVGTRRPTKTAMHSVPAGSALSYKRKSARPGRRTRSAARGADETARSDATDGDRAQVGSSAACSAPPRCWSCSQ